MRHKTIMVGSLAVTMIFLAVSFFVGSSFRHQAWPITQRRIDQAKDPEERAFLIEQRDKKARELQEEKAQSVRLGLVALFVGAASGAWYLRLRNRRE